MRAIVPTALYHYNINNDNNNYNHNIKHNNNNNSRNSNDNERKESIVRQDLPHQRKPWITLSPKQPKSLKRELGQVVS